MGGTISCLPACLHGWVCSTFLGRGIAEVVWGIYGMESEEQGGSSVAHTEICYVFLPCLCLPACVYVLMFG